ncbi:MAG: hypothetical protein QW185_04540 [Thermofilum sp.]
MLVDPPASFNSTVREIVVGGATDPMTPTATMGDRPRGEPGGLLHLFRKDGALRARQRQGNRVDSQRSGLRETLDWYRQHGYLVKELAKHALEK